MQTLTNEELRYFTEDLVRYRHPINQSVIYTPGVRHVAEKGGAYWLIDTIASHIGSPPFERASARDHRIDSMHFWTFEKGRGTTGQLIAQADSDEDPFIVQNIPFTDFPLETINIWAAFDGEHWVLYLPSEH